MNLQNPQRLDVTSRMHRAGKASRSREAAVILERLRTSQEEWERKYRRLQGNAFPKPADAPTSAGPDWLDPEAVSYLAKPESSEGSGLMGRDARSIAKHA